MRLVLVRHGESIGNYENRLQGQEDYDLTDLGFALVLFPIGALLTATRSVREFYGAILRDGTPRAVLGELPPFDEFTSFMGLPEIDDLGQRFAER